jgi:hypothetical protein
MQELPWLTPALQVSLLDAGANLLGGLVTNWIDGLLRAGGSKLRHNRRGRE